MTSGAIRIDGQDIREDTLVSLKKKAIGVVQQDIVLFNTTISYKVTYS